MARATKIDPQAWYTLQDLVRSRMFPWATSFWSVRRIVASDRRSKNLLQTQVAGTGRGKKYHFKGEHIIKFISEATAGKPWLTTK